jgi:FMN-dependent NADH-azoreductase
MSKVLLIHSSMFGNESKSLGLARELIARLPHTSLVERPLAPDTIPHLDAETLKAMRVPEAARTDQQKELLALSDALIAELEAADTIVLAAPMYNFSISSTLKAWIDHVARAGRTFRYTAAGPEGLLKGKKVFVVTARGSIFSEGPNGVMDFQEPYIRGVLRFIGLDDVTFVHLEGLSISPEAAAKGLARARDTLDGLLPGRVAA